MKSGKLSSRLQLQRCAESGALRICFCLGFPEPHTRQYEALPLILKCNGQGNMNEQSIFQKELADEAYEPKWGTSNVARH